MWTITLWAEGEHAGEYPFEGSEEAATAKAEALAKVFATETGRSTTWEVKTAENGRYYIFDSDGNLGMDADGYPTLPEALAAAQALVLHVWGALDRANGATEYEVASVCDEFGEGNPRPGAGCYARVQAREANKILDDAGFPHTRGARPLLIAEVTFTELGRDTLSWAAEQET